VFFLAVVLAVATIALMPVVRLLRQAADQWAAAAVAERAGQRLIAEGNDAALKNAGRAVVSMSLAEREPDADAEVLNEAVQLLAGRRIATDGFDPIHEVQGLPDLRLDARRQFAGRHPLLEISE
jgi:hypothetical protein